MKSKVGCYVYGVLETEKPVRFKKNVRGLPNTGPLRAIPLFPKVQLVAADAPFAHYSSGAIEACLQNFEWVSARALAHERVVEACASLGTMVPMKLFTIFESDARAVQAMTRIQFFVQDALARIRGKREWGVRLYLRNDAGELAQEVFESDASIGPGTSFLERKRRVQVFRRELAKEAPQTASRVCDELGLCAEEVLRKPLSTNAAQGTLVLDAVFLVHSLEEEKFRTSAEGLRDRLSARGYELMLSGSWPAYHFVGEGLTPARNESGQANSLR